jgi:hypothetical protein
MDLGIYTNAQTRILPERVDRRITASATREADIRFPSAPLSFMGEWGSVGRDG